MEYSSYDSIVRAANELAANPTDERGFARHITIDVAFIANKALMWEIHDATCIAMRDAVRESMRKHASGEWAGPEWPESIEWEVRAGGEGTVGGLNGHVSVTLTPARTPVYFA